MEHAVTLNPTTWQALAEIAVAEDCSVQDLVHDAVKRDLFRRTRAKKAARTDERLVAPLRALLAEDIATAENWADLTRRLHRKGYALQEAGAGLALFDLKTNRRLCKASELGFSYGQLMRRFAAPMPGHSHSYLAPKLGVSLASSR